MCVGFGGMNFVRVRFDVYLAYAYNYWISFRFLDLWSGSRRWRVRGYLSFKFPKTYPVHVTVIHAHAYKYGLPCDPRNLFAPTNPWDDFIPFLPFLRRRICPLRRPRPPALPHWPLSYFFPLSPSQAFRMGGNLIALVSELQCVFFFLCPIALKLPQSGNIGQRS